MLRNQHAKTKKSGLSFLKGAKGKGVKLAWSEIVALIIVQWLLETKGVGCRTFAHHGRDGQRVAVKDYAIKRVP